MPLTPANEQFCREYLVDLNGSAAYRRAYPGVSEKVARSNACRLMADPQVQERVAELQRERIARSELSADRVLRELTRIAFADARSIYRPDGTLKPPHEWDDATAAAVAGVETEEQVRPTSTKEELDPGPLGGALKRTRTDSVEPVRTHKLRRWDKLRALELLCKHFGLLKEDAPHPDRPQIELSKLTDQQKLTLLTLLRALRGS